MKKTKVSLLALSVLAGGLMGAAAASVPDVGAGYNLSMSFGTNANGATIPIVFDVSGFPSPTTNNVFFEPFGIQTDGSGKVEGVGLLRISFDGTDTNGVELVVQVTGAMGNKGTATTVSLSMKATGRSQNLGLHGAASGSLKFTATSITPLTAGSVTNTYYVTTITNVSGGTVTNGAATNILGGPFTNGTLLVFTSNSVPGYNGTNYVVGTFTNTSTYNNTAANTASGTLAGSISTGLKAKTVSKIAYKALPANLPDGTVVTVTGTNVSFAEFGLSKHAIEIDAYVVQIGKKMYLAGDSPFLSAGTATADGKGGYKASLTGLGSARGSSLAFAGTTMAALPISYDRTFTTNITGTNYYSVVTNIAVNGISTVSSAKGKVLGQAVTATPGAGFGGNTSLPTGDPTHDP
jgi:hypothetical protein